MHQHPMQMSGFFDDLETKIKAAVNTAISTGRSETIANLANLVIQNPAVQQASKEQLERSMTQQLADEIMRLRQQGVVAYAQQNPGKVAIGAGTILLVAGGLAAVFLMVTRR